MPTQRSKRNLLAGLLLVLAACEGATGPEDPFGLEMRLVGAPIFNVAVPAHSVGFECLARVELRASGRGSATMTGLRRRAYRGVDRTQPSDSVTYASGQWPGQFPTTLSGAEQDTVTILTYGSQPFAVEYILSYQASGGGAERSDSLRFDCGAAVLAGAAEPAVTLLEMRGSDPVLETGDTLIVQYRVTGGAPLWQTDIQVYGAFTAHRTIYEEMLTSTEREVRIVVPEEASLDSAVAVLFTHADVGGRIVQVRDTADIQVVDVTPPTLGSVQVTAGQYAVGTFFRLTFTGSDERRPSHIVWEFGAPVAARDSTPWAQADFRIDFQVRPEWAGKSATLHVWVRDEGGNYSTPYSSAVDAFSFHADVPPPPMVHGTLAHNSDEIVYDAPRGRLYAVDTERARLEAFDIASMTSLGIISLPAWPGAADLSPSGDSLLITQSLLRALSVVDLGSLTLVDTVPLPTVDSLAGAESTDPPLPTGVRVAANGKAMVTLHKEAVGGFNTVEVDLSTGTTRLRTDVVGGGGTIQRWWDRMAVTADRSRLFIFDPFCARVYGSSSDTFSSCVVGVDPGLNAKRISSDTASTRIMINGVVFDPALTQVGSVPYAITHLLPDGLHAFATSGDHLLKVRVSDGRITSRTEVGSAHRLMLLADGHTLLMFGEPGSVRKLDVAGLP